MPDDGWITVAHLPGLKFVSYAPGLEAWYEHRHGDAVVMVGHCLRQGSANEGLVRMEVRVPGDCPLVARALDPWGSDA